MWVLLVFNHHVSGYSDLLQLDPFDVRDNLDVKLAVPLVELPDLVLLEIPNALVEGVDGALDGGLCLKTGSLLAGTHHAHES